MDRDIEMRKCKAIFLRVLASLCVVLSMNTVQAEGEMKHVELSIYINPVGAPFAFFTDDIYTLQGIDIDIIKELQNRLGFTIKEDRIFPLSPEAAFAQMKNKQVDLYGGGMSYNQQYAREFAPLAIYVKSSLGVLYSTKFHPEIKSTKHLKGLKIGALPGRDTDKFVAKFGATLSQENSLAYAVFKVSQQRLDGLMHDRLILQDFAKTIKNPNIAVLPEEFGKNLCQYTFYVPKVSIYRRHLASAMQRMVNDGTITRILQKWGVEIKKPIYKRRNKPSVKVSH